MCPYLSIESSPTLHMLIDSPILSTKALRLHTASPANHLFSTVETISVGITTAPDREGVFRMILHVRNRPNLEILVPAYWLITSHVT